MCTEKQDNIITILTPTYNRESDIHRLYNSLRNQVLCNFKWVVIDDGSSDNTSKYFSQILIEDNEFEIEYYKKANGGKHTAINYGFKYLTTPLTFIVDSDDELTSDATSTIGKYYEKHEDKYCAFSFLRADRDLNVIGMKYPEDEYVSTFSKCRIIEGIYGDKAEVFLTRDLVKKKFPVYPNEKFIGEDYLWTKLCDHKSMLFINKTIYICEYQEDGLTNSVRKINVNSPKGNMDRLLEYYKKEYTIKIRIKSILLHNTYAFIDKLNIKRIFRSFKRRPILTFFTMPLSVVLAVYWSLKYKDK